MKKEIKFALFFTLSVVVQLLITWYSKPKLISKKHLFSYLLNCACLIVHIHFEMIPLLVWNICIFVQVLPIYLTFKSGILFLQMGNVWFCCWDANRVCNRLRLCWSSKDPSLEFWDNRFGMNTSIIYTVNIFLLLYLV